MNHSVKCKLSEVFLLRGIKFHHGSMTHKLHLLLWQGEISLLILSFLLAYLLLGMGQLAPAHPMPPQNSSLFHSSHVDHTITTAYPLLHLGKRGQKPTGGNGS
jgi:hypothetical protein